MIFVHDLKNSAGIFRMEVPWSVTWVNFFSEFIAGFHSSILRPSMEISFRFFKLEKSRPHISDASYVILSFSKLVNDSQLWIFKPWEIRVEMHFSETGNLRPFCYKLKNKFFSNSSKKGNKRFNLPACIGKQANTLISSRCLSHCWSSMFLENIKIR